MMGLPFNIGIQEIILILVVLAVLSLFVRLSRSIVPVRKPYWATTKGLRGRMGRTPAEGAGTSTSTSTSRSSSSSRSTGTRKTRPADTGYLKKVLKNVGGRAWNLPPQ